MGHPGPEPVLTIEGATVHSGVPPQELSGFAAQSTPNSCQAITFVGRSVFDYSTPPPGGDSCEHGTGPVDSTPAWSCSITGRVELQFSAASTRSVLSVR